MFRTKLTSCQPIPQGAHGSAAIEFAVAAPLLMILIIGTAEVGYSAYQAMQVQNAVEAGALYAVKSGSGVSGITNAVLRASDVTGLSVVPPPANFCGCPGDSGIVAEPCTSSCANGYPPGHYIQIDATLIRQTLIPDSGLPLPTVLSAQSIIRLQ
jgi:hypothetical protein